jgi:hypothetical protein
MKKINIIGSQLVKTDLRFAHENPITTTNAEAQRLHDGGMLLDEPVDTDGKDDPEPTLPEPPRGDADNG